MKFLNVLLLSSSLLLTFPAFSADTPKNSAVPKKEEKTVEKKEEKASEKNKGSFLLKAVTYGLVFWEAATAASSIGLKTDKSENKNSK